MSDTDHKPIIFLAFANDRDDAVGYLRNLPEEARRLCEVLDTAEKAGLCEVVVRSNRTSDNIFKVFQDSRYRNRIAIFHYGGHASGYQLLLESAAGQVAMADAGGFAAFLAQQRGVQLVFLNGCWTQSQTQGLLDAGISAVISTSRAIDDKVATDFAFQFYQGLAGGATIRTAYHEAEASIVTTRGRDTRGFYFGAKDNTSSPGETDRLPWSLSIREGSEHSDQWNLPGAVGDPLFGLPQLPNQDLPESPYRHMNWFTREDAEIFFGRGHQIRELYDRLTAPNTAPILLFYGQSGVGKSSILDAGLIPRLEQGYEVRYLRRGDRGLLNTLKQAFLPEADDLAIEGAWRLKEEKLHKPLIVFLDQVEELFIRPIADLPDELEQLLKAVQAIFADPNSRPQGKLLLGFRKEWLAELEAQLAAFELPWPKLFLESLDRRGIIEVVRGPTRSARIRERYGLTIEDGLAEIIADDLLEDRGSPIAPTLQILLTKMWAKATESNYERPHFSRDLYQQLKREGILLRDFLDQQIAAFQKEFPDIVDSGLLLDMIAMHTTQLGTANQRSIAQLQTEYSHLGTKLPRILHLCQDLYLLTISTKEKKECSDSTRLAHDTLAPLVRERNEHSDKPGQRARRILNNRTVDWSPIMESVPLDLADLAIVEKGALGTRVFNTVELRLIETSRELRDKMKRTRRRMKYLGLTAAVVTAWLVSYAIWKGIEAQRKLVLARQSVEAMLKLYLEIPERAGDIAAAETLENAQKAFDRLENNGLPTAMRITSPAIESTIRKFKQLLESPDDNAGATCISKDRQGVILELVRLTRDAWESRLAGRNDGSLADTSISQEKRPERDIITSRLCRREVSVTSAIAQAQNRKEMIQFRPEFERLCWAELYSLELEEKAENSDGRSSLEESMVAFRRHGLKDWESDKISNSILDMRAREVARCCNALVRNP